MKQCVWIVATMGLLAACGGDSDLPLPTMQMVSINATTTPAGATVTVDGHTLPNPTPLAGVQYPAPFQEGAAMSLNFTLNGHESTTTAVTPVQGVVTVNAVLNPVPEAGNNAPIGRDINQRFNGGGTIRDMRRVSANGSIDRNCTVDTMGIVLHGRHAFHGDLSATVRLPNGQTKSFARGRGRNSRFFGRRFRVRDVSGISSAGQYVVTIRDRMRQDSGRFTGFTLSIGCR